MFVLTDDKPLRIVIQEKALILWEKIIRVPGYLSLWNEVNQDLTRNLKTQMGFLQRVFQLKNSLGLMRTRITCSTTKPGQKPGSNLGLDLGQKVTKRNTDPSILRAFAFEVLNIFYSEPECLRIFTDGSLLSDGPNAGAGVFSEIFSFYIPVGRGSEFDSEIAAIRTALYQLPCPLEKFTRAVIFSGSRAALLAIVSHKNPTSQDISDCRHYLKKTGFT
ncbi:uncharacterized protein LOC118201842 [Stegodyphus dumicola]|uniref:uncharacterized protein LOC118201842 n=1 Tax=Stegodyphus dumicola TaxID=202533 RepID=UPI0015B1B5D6|nr:uncharacterized protein LOC118201842 [Stegodyphus dumicola]